MMESSQIKKKIDENNRKIEQIFNPATFILNEEIQTLLKENEALRAECAHEFDKNGICIFCYAKRGED
jgi:hypothetical protein